MSQVAVNFNSRVLDAYPEALFAVQRAMLFGDTLFETIRVFDHKIPLLDRHWRRLSAGLQALSFHLPGEWDVSFFQREIAKVSPPNARVRLSVWRSPGGLYLPERHEPVFMISARALDAAFYEWPRRGISLGLSEKTRLPVDAFSNYKTLNSARYVAASLEAREKGWDDALLLNAYERISEATSSNVFWWEGDGLCTVPLAEGCVAGVQRAFLLETARAGGFAVQEKPATFATLKAAHEIFLTNAVRGLIPVSDLSGEAKNNAQTKLFFERSFSTAYAEILR